MVDGARVRSDPERGVARRREEGFPFGSEVGRLSFGFEAGEGATINAAGLVPGGNGTGSSFAAVGALAADDKRRARC